MVCIYTLGKASTVRPLQMPAEKKVSRDKFYGLSLQRIFEGSVVPMQSTLIRLSFFLATRKDILQTFRFLGMRCKFIALELVTKSHGEAYFSNY